MAISLQESISKLLEYATVLKAKDINSKEFWANKVGTAIDVAKYGRQMKIAEECIQIAKWLEKLQEIEDVISEYSSPFASDMANGFYEIEQIVKEVE